MTKKRVGNRTNHVNDNTDAIVAGNLAHKELIQLCKKRVLATRAQSKIQVELLPYYLECFSNYVEKQRELDRPLTIAGFCLAANISDDVFYRTINTDYDYIIEEYKLIHELPDDTTEITICLC